jgi:hypothetical protein
MISATGIETHQTTQRAMPEDLKGETAGTDVKIL